MKGHKKVNPWNRDSTKNGPSIQRHNFLWAAHMTTHTACHLSYCQSVTQTNLYQPSRTNNNKKRLEQPIQTDPSPGHWPPPRAFSPFFVRSKKNAIPNHHRELLWFPCLGAGIDTHTHKRNRRDTARYYYQTMSPRVQSVIEMTGAVTFR